MVTTLEGQLQESLAGIFVLKMDVNFLEKMCKMFWIWYRIFSRLAGLFNYDNCIMSLDIFRAGSELAASVYV